MKINFEQLEYQTKAVESTLAIFNSHTLKPSEFTIDISNKQSTLFNVYNGIGNDINWNYETLLENIQNIQLDNNIPVDDTIDIYPYPQFNIEMETGTGKTFVYFKTILELNKKYGFTKFIIVVPSIAIKQGVLKTAEMTKDYFMGQFNGVVYNVKEYDSGDANATTSFASSSQVEIMVMNIQKFNSTKNNIYEENDRTRVAPIELIKECQPILIIDEPQSVDNTENAKEALKNLNPSCALRYSATHRDLSYPLIYKLGPIEAYEQKLVKQIEVSGIDIDADGNEKYIKLVGFNRKKTTVEAKVELYVKTSKDYDKKIITLKKGDNLSKKTKNSNYDSFGDVDDIYDEEINKMICFTGEPAFINYNDRTSEDLDAKRIQIKETIKTHLNKELVLNEKGVKVLSLFFIDKVENYRSSKDGELGIYAKIFEEEYKDMIARNPKYQKLRDYNIDVSEVHDGYFAVDGKGRYKNSRGESKDDETTFEMIMKDKEGLLTFYDESKGNTKSSNKLRFIFSHSALKEGWDNPNVFQICTLIDSKDTITKRQKIGRGLRICVNQEGNRYYNFDDNVLTVIANESYQDFAEGLQSEYEEDGIKFGVFDDDIFTNLIISENDEETKILGKEKSALLVGELKEKGFINNKKQGTVEFKKALDEEDLKLSNDFKMYNQQIIIESRKHIKKPLIKDARNRITVTYQKENLNDSFKELWKRINEKTTYYVNFNTENFIEEANEILVNSLDVKSVKYGVKRGNLVVENVGISTVNETTASYTVKPKEYDIPDIVSYLSIETKLTRKTIVKILNINSDKILKKIKINPQVFLSNAVLEINNLKQQYIVDGIKYELTGEQWEQSLFDMKDLDAYSDKAVLVKNNKSPYDYVIYDSDIEKRFAQDADKNENTKFFIKLPYWFTINTPLGTYNPDWALLKDENDTKQLYFVVETKGLTRNQLPLDQKGKVDSGEKHFEAINEKYNSEINYKVVEDFNEV